MTIFKTFRYPFGTQQKGLDQSVTTALKDNFRNAEGQLSLIDAALDELWAARAGVIEDFMLPSTAVPAGAVLCYGQQLTTDSPLRTALIAAGNPYGTSGGNPLLPDLRGRGRAGLDNMGGADAGRLSWANTIGTTGGTETHTLTAAQSGLPAHGHTVAPSSSLGGFVVASSVGGSAGIVTGGAGYNLHASETTANNAAASASQSHNNMQPTMLLNAIAWTGARP